MRRWLKKGLTFRRYPSFRSHSEGAQILSALFRISRRLFSGAVAALLAGPLLASNLTARQEVEAFVREAAAHLERVGPEQAFSDFNDKTGRFIRGSLYIFCATPDGTILAHGANPALSGRNLSILRDAEGRPFVVEMLMQVLQRGSTWASYMWPNPQTHRTEEKESFVTRVRSDIYCGSGSYSMDSAWKAMQLGKSRD